MVNPRLVYGRMTGWGQSGPYATNPGHDINYVAVTGILNAIGEEGGKPVPPLNLIGDFGGGGMLMAVGILSALLERGRSGVGQVVDSAMLDGSFLLATQAFGMVADGRWIDQRGANTLDGGAPYYGVYPTADGGYVSVGALERRFFDDLLDTLGLAGRFPDQHDRDCWPEMRQAFAAAFRTRTGDEWAQLASDRQLCVSPVRSFRDAHRDEQSQARGCFVDVGGVPQPAPAPRFDRTPAAVPDEPPAAGEHTVEILLDAGFTGDAVADLAAHNIVRAPASVHPPSGGALFPGG
jgi:alpha-methylacyl-CoA racemase